MYYYSTHFCDLYKSVIEEKEVNNRLIDIELNDPVTSMTTDVFNNYLFLGQ